MVDNVRILLPPPDAAPGDGAADFEGDVEALTTVRPRVSFNITDEQHGAILERITDELLAQNEMQADPLLYNASGEYIAYARNITVSPVDRTGMMLRLMWFAEWVAGENQRATDPPSSIVAGLLHRDHRLLRSLPLLRYVTAIPTFSESGVLETEPGYRRASATFYNPNGLVIPPVPDEPASDDIERARQIILDDVLGDFAFVGQPELANAVAMLLLAFVRPMIDGPVPMHGIDAASQGTGKTYLVDTLSTVLTATPIEPLVLSGDEEERRKEILAELLSAPPVINFDNLDYHLKSRVLNMLITGGGVRGRKLGVTEMLSLKCNSVLTMTGNNLSLGRELMRRVVRIRMERDIKEPVKWRHPDLIAWIKENRGDVVWSLATFVKAWLAAGKPNGSAPEIESFGPWVRTMSGILETVGIEGLLGNDEEWNDETETDPESELLSIFLKRWWGTYRERPKQAKDLLPIALDIGLPLKAPSNDLQKAAIALGLYLRAQRGRWLDGHRIESAGKDRNGVGSWRVVKK